MNPEQAFKDHHQRLIDSFQSHRQDLLDDPEHNLSALIRFIKRELLPHAEAEEEVLYRKLDEVAGTALATATMRHDHKEITARAETLEQESTRQGGSNESIREAVNELSAILLLHFDKEEEVLLPVLSSALSDQEFDSILSRVHEQEHAHG